MSSHELGIMPLNAGHLPDSQPIIVDSDDSLLPRPVNPIEADQAGEFDPVIGLWVLGTAVGFVVLRMANILPYS